MGEGGNEGRDAARLRRRTAIQEVVTVMDFQQLKKRAQDELGKRTGMIDQGLDKASGFAKSRVQGRDNQIDSVVDKAKSFVRQTSGQDGSSGPEGGSSGGPSGGPSSR